MSFYEKLGYSAEAMCEMSLGYLFWYLALACALTLVFSVLFRAYFRPKRISLRDPTRQQISREILYSLRSIVIFGLVTAAVVFAALSGHTLLYRRVETYGWFWFVLSIPVMLLMHDTYFYWTHRLMHHGRLYRLFHHTHHLSTNPTVWAAYSFSPLEALVQAGIGPLIVFTIPVHDAAFGIFMTWQIAFNVLGHCGYEIYPQWFLRSPCGWILNTVTHHAQHHEKFRSNYGLYFNFWDRVMGTNHLEYQSRFESVAGHS